MKKWGKLCEEAVKILLQLLRGDHKDIESVAALLQNRIDEIANKGVRGVISVQDVLDNVCLFTHGCIKGQGKKHHKPGQENKQHKPGKEKKHHKPGQGQEGLKDPVWSPINPLYEGELDDVIRSYREKIYGKIDQVQEDEVESVNNLTSLGPFAGGSPHQAVKEFVEKQRSGLFRAPAWCSKIPVQHYGPLITKNSWRSKRSYCTRASTMAADIAQKEVNPVQRSLQKTLTSSKLLQTAASTILRYLKRR